MPGSFLAWEHQPLRARNYTPSPVPPQGTPRSSRHGGPVWRAGFCPEGQGPPGALCSAQRRHSARWPVCWAAKAFLHSVTAVGVCIGVHPSPHGTDSRAQHPTTTQSLMTTPAWVGEGASCDLNLPRPPAPGGHVRRPPACTEPRRHPRPGKAACSAPVSRRPGDSGFFEACCLLPCLGPDTLAFRGSTPATRHPLTL